MTNGRPPTGDAPRPGTRGPHVAAPPSWTVVVPTVGRPSLATLLDALAAADGPSPSAVLVVDDRPPSAPPLRVPDQVGDAPVAVLSSGARGPARAREVGWRVARTEWVAFLDDDVVPGPRWLAELATDLAGLLPDVGGSQGRLRVPRPPGRRPVDWERNVVALEDACWATADLAYRRDVLMAVGGFDPRFRRAFREDTDLGLRVTESGWTIVRGERRATHPVRAAGWWASVRAQRGNRDDVLMRALHGPGWRIRAAAGPSRTGRHLLTVAAGLVALVGAARRRRPLAVAGIAGWAVGTAELSWVRVAPGPRTAGEVATMVATSAAIPVVATSHIVVALSRLRSTLAAPGPAPARPAVRAVLFDRDGTLVTDVPYNGRPELVEPVPGAADAVHRLREGGLKLGVVTNQSGVARGILTASQVARVNRRVDELLGPMDTWQVCPHGPGDGCQCRKPGPALVERAAAALGVPVGTCVVVGDVGADVTAARAAGARAILVPTPATRPGEVAASPEVAPTLAAAADRILGGPA